MAVSAAAYVLPAAPPASAPPWVHAPAPPPAREEPSTPSAADPDDPRIHHAELVRISRSGTRVDRAIGRTLRRLRALDGVTALGFARFPDYVRERLGQSPRWAQVCIRLDRVCETFPAVAAAHASGRLTASHVLAIAPALDDRNARAWVACATEHTVRELRARVAAARRTGDGIPAEYAHLVSSPEDGDAAEHPACAPGPDEAPIGNGDSRDGGDPPTPESPPEERVLLQLAVPAPVASLFDHAIDVARRLGGHDAPVHACVEQMLAEYASGHEVESALDIDPSEHVAWGLGPDPTRPARLRTGEGEEIAAEVRSRRWRDLRIPAARPGQDPVVDRVPPPDPVALDAHLIQLLAVRRARHERLAESLGRFAFWRRWRRLGFVSLAHYCREELGISGRLAQELTRVHWRTEQMPELGQAHRGGEVSWAKLRLIAEVCEVESVGAWIDRARRVTCRYLEREVRHARHRRDADPAGWAADPGPRPLQHVPPYAASSAVRPGVDLWADARLDPAIAGAGGAEVGDAGAGDAHMSARAADAHTSARGEGASRLATPIELPCRIRVWMPESLYWLWCDVDVSIARALGGTSARWERLVVLLRVFLEQWDTRRYEEWSAGSAVHRRFGWMCAAPGCTARRGLEGHHIDRRSQGGSDDPENLASLCAAHHRIGVHGGDSLRVAGRAPDALEWELPIGRYLGDVCRAGPDATGDDRHTREEPERDHEPGGDPEPGAGPEPEADPEPAPRAGPGGS